jgi:hypothetical protein
MGNPHLAAMRRLFEGNRMRHDTYILFGDCMEAMAIAMSNAVDLRQRDMREARYLEIVGRYERDIVAMFPQVMAQLAAGLEHERDDLLGALFHDLELHNTARGQFFTPYTVSRMMAEATLGSPEHLRGLVEARGFVTAMEPACGAGSMVIALADAMQTAGINYQHHLHVTAVDIDPRAIHMAYAQLSLLHVPAHLIVGNSLSLELREHWYTPAHIFGGWNARLRAAAAGQIVGGPVSPAPRTVQPSARPAPEERVARPSVEPIATMPRQLTLF